MSTELSLDKFKYFLLCYFNMSADYSDLEQLALEYKNNETEDNCQQLIEELHSIVMMENWEFIRQFVKEHGMRNLSDERIKKMIEIVLKGLS